jgi:hypothetical protein
MDIKEKVIKNQKFLEPLRSYFLKEAKKIARAKGFF